MCLEINFRNLRLNVIEMKCFFFLKFLNFFGGGILKIVWKKRKRTISGIEKWSFC